MRRILCIPFLLLFALCATASQQTPTDVNRSSYTDRQATMLGLVRTINTFEVGDLSRNGLYETWPALLEHNESEFNSWLARNWSQPAGNETPRRFSALPEVLPGMKLRLNVNADGHGFTVLIEDSQDKNGFAFFADERGVIRESKYIY